MTYYNELKYGSEAYWRLNEYILSQIPIMYSVMPQGKKVMSEQSELIGEHPTSGIFNEWCEFEDILASVTKK